MVEEWQCGRLAKCMVDPPFHPFTATPFSLFQLSSVVGCKMVANQLGSGLFLFPRCKTRKGNNVARLIPSPPFHLPNPSPFHNITFLLKRKGRWGESVEIWQGEKDGEVACPPSHFSPLHPFTFPPLSHKNVEGVESRKGGKVDMRQSGTIDLFHLPPSTFPCVRTSFEM